VRSSLVAALAALAALTLAACTSTDAGSRGGPGTSSPAVVGASPTDSRADVDLNAAMAKATCAEAARINEDGAAAFNAGVDNMVKLAAEGDQAGLDAAEADLRATLTAWSVKLIEMSGRPVAPVGALEEGAATIEKIADNSRADEAKETIAHVGNKIRAACAGSS
jgi:hypothetical protein